jgi:hypothetical protein
MLIVGTWISSNVTNKYDHQKQMYVLKMLSRVEIHKLLSRSGVDVSLEEIGKRSGVILMLTGT